MTGENLNGPILMVHPELYDDPAKKNGEICVLTSANSAEDIFHVRFDDNQRGRYAGNALLTFRPFDQIDQRLKLNGQHLSLRDSRDLKNMALLLDYGTTERQRAAMEIAGKNPAILPVWINHMKMPPPDQFKKAPFATLPVALMSLEESLALIQSHKRGR